MNFAQVKADLTEMLDDRLDDLQTAEVEVRLADAALAQAELSADMRTWTAEERAEWESAHFRVRAAYDALRKAREAL